jgi:hypothetical protein
MSVKEMVSKILKEATEEELREANRVIVQELKRVVKMRSWEASLKFKVGDKAVFTNRKGEKVTILIEKVGPKNVVGREVSSRLFPSRWRVNASMLKITD